jgi:hypothetical protein
MMPARTRYQSPAGNCARSTLRRHRAVPDRHGARGRTSNAIDHGNLELDSDLREEESNAYSMLRLERATQAPYRDRRVRVSERLTPNVVEYRVLDEGKGFTSRRCPTRFTPSACSASGRGLLIRTFMDDEVQRDGHEITLTWRRRAANG